MSLCKEIGSMRWRMDYCFHDLDSNRKCIDFDTPHEAFYKKKPLQREFLGWEGGGCLNCEINFGILQFEFKMGFVE